MMKLKHIFAAVASFLSVLSCSDLAGEKGDYVPFETVVPEICTAGSVLIVQGEFADDVRFFLQKEGEEPRLLTQETDEFFYDKVSAEFRLPYTLGKYSLIIEQNGKPEHYDFNIAVTGVDVPDESDVNVRLTIKGIGFSKDAVLVLAPVGGGEPVELETEQVSGGISCFIGPSIAKGRYALSVIQEGTEQLLSESLVIGIMKKLLVTFESDYASYEIVYNADGIPVSFAGHRITMTENNCSFEGLDFSFNLENGRIGAINMLGGTYVWEYDAAGYLATAEIAFEKGSGEIDTEFHRPVFNKGNYVGKRQKRSDGTFDYFTKYDYGNSTRPNKLKTVDFAFIDYCLSTEALDQLAPAAMLGLIGNVSSSLPVKILDDNDVWQDIEMKFDEDGYCIEWKDPYKTLKFTYKECID